MKTSRFTPAFLVALGSTLPALHSFGFAEFARGPILLDTKLTAGYDSYFIGSSSKDTSGDSFATLAPTLTYSRNAGRGSIDLAAGVSFTRYDRNSDQDSEDAHASASITLPTAPGSRLDGSLNASYTEETSVDDVVQDRIASKTAGLNLAFRYQLGLKTSLSESVRYNKSWRDGAYGDQETLGNNLGFTYSDFLGKTSLNLGHTYTSTSSGGVNERSASLDQESHAFSAGLSRPIYGSIKGSAGYGYRFLDRSAAETIIGQTQNNGGYFTLGLDGPFLPPARFPKLKSSLSLAYEQPTSLGINDTGGKTLTGNLGLSWDARERTSVSINASRNVNLTATDLSVETTQVALGVTERLGDFTTVTANLGYQWNTYRGVSREDNSLTGSLSAGRRLNKNWSLGAAYRFFRNENSSASTLAPRLQGADYTRHLVTATLGYIF